MPLGGATSPRRCQPGRMRETKMSVANETTPLTDHKLAAAAPLAGGRLQQIAQDPTTGRLTFIFSDLPPTFVQDVFNGDMTVNLRDYINALEQVHALIAQYRARRERR